VNSCQFDFQQVLFSTRSTYDAKSEIDTGMDEDRLPLLQMFLPLQLQDQVYSANKMKISVLIQCSPFTVEALLPTPFEDSFTGCKLGILRVEAVLHDIGHARKSNVDK